MARSWFDDFEDRSLAHSTLLASAIVAGALASQPMASAMPALDDGSTGIPALDQWLGGTLCPTPTKLTTPGHIDVADNSVRR